MPSRSTTLADEPRAEAVMSAGSTEAKEPSLLPARILAVGAWVLAPILFWGAAIAAVLHLIQRVR